MYIEVDRKHNKQRYWLVKPTLSEQNDIATMPAREKRELWYGVWFVAAPVLLLLLFVGVMARVYGDSTAPTWTVLIPLGLLMVPIVAFAIAMIRGNYESTLRRMKKERRAFDLEHTYWSDRENIAKTLLHEILLGGERYLENTDYRFQVIRQLRPALVNSLIADAVLADALVKYSSASSKEGREAWLAVIEPQIAKLITEAQPLIDQLRADEQQDAELAATEAETKMQRDLNEVQRFTRDHGWAG